MKYEKEPPGKVVIEKNTIYEIDLDCVREKEKCKQEEKEKKLIHTNRTRK